MSSWNDIDDIVRGSRVVHEKMLRNSEIRSTAGTCLYASFVLRLSLEKFGGCTAVVRGGDGHGDGGALDSGGTLRGHYWVEGVTPDGVAFTADITADQFGHEPVYFERAALSRARYRPGCDATVRVAVLDLVRSTELARDSDSVARPAQPA
ncbi:hypothetical protein [Duganella vulcania]|uniref:Uncharacterized protein n=1 Tax=Duganella vulcania TaxID=2692166 RepID=A0A845GGB5_9BURK|nr:hypothetical protein [Duganella vulcania]MYM92425.1 hypothetical protein [Duganella vulcania]